MKNIWITGADSQLGQQIKAMENYFLDMNLTYYSKLELDVTNKDSIEEKLNKNLPDYIINTAAYTAVDLAESEIEKAKEINTNSIQNFVTVLKNRPTVFIHISTDFVFDGKSKKPYLPSDKTNPINRYGQTKRAGEEILENASIPYFVIRTSWLYSAFGTNFLKTILRLSVNHKELNVVSNQIGTPTYAGDLVEVLLKMIQSNFKNYGIYHFSNKGFCSWYDFATFIFKSANKSICVKPILDTAYKTAAERPKFSVLDSDLLLKKLNLSHKPWKLGVQKVINQLNEVQK